MCEGVGEDSRHGIGHVDIQVGSCIYLNVIVSGTGSVQEDNAYKRPHFRRKPGCGFGIHFVEHVLKL